MSPSHNYRSLGELFLIPWGVQFTCDYSALSVFQLGFFLPWNSSSRLSVCFVRIPQSCVLGVVVCSKSWAHSYWKLTGHGLDVHFEILSLQHLLWSIFRCIVELFSSPQASSLRLEPLLCSTWEKLHLIFRRIYKLQLFSLSLQTQTKQLWLEQCPKPG